MNDAPAPSPQIPAPRIAALELLLRWDREKRVFIEHLLHDHLRETSYPAADRGLLTQICYGVVRHRNTLRRLSMHYCHQPLERHPREIRMSLAIGLFQLVYLNTPPHAMVDETVRMWDTSMGKKMHGRRRDTGKGFLNATLRRAASEIERVGRSDEGSAKGSIDGDSPGKDAFGNDADVIHTPEGWVRVRGLKLPSRTAHNAERLGIQYSHPPEMVRLWLERMDEETVVRFLTHNNRPPRLCLVLRDPEADVEVYCRLLQSFGIGAAPTGYPGTVEVTHGGPVMALPGYSTGDFWVQDLTAHRLTLLMPERPGATLLDLCAAPGGKFCTLLRRDPDRPVLACDIRHERLELLARNLDRLQFDLRKLEVLEVNDDPGHLRLDRSFDQILVDAPCSNTGVLARRHEARWRLLPEKMRDFHRIQLGLLRASARHLAPGGDLLYTTCSIEPGENSEMVHDFMRGQAELRLVEEVEVIPGEEPWDGGYAALMKRVT